MLNEEFADRTLPPTQRRRREARMRGQVACSSDLTSALVLLVVSGALWFIAPGAVNGFAQFMRNSITAAASTTSTTAATVELAQLAIRIALGILAPVWLATMFSGLLGSLGQNGWLWVHSALVPRIRFSQLISADSVVSAIGSLLRLGVLVGVSSQFVMSRNWQLQSVGIDEPVRMLVQTARMLGELAIQLGVSLFLIGMIDYGYRYWRNEQRLKMTIEERRREQQEEETNPQTKKRRMAWGGRRDSSTSLPGIGRVEATS